MAKGDKSQNTKNALALALKGLVRKLPLRKISVRAVTQRAGVDRQTFYYHFETMDDLVVHLCRMCVSVSSADTMRCQSSAELFRLLISQGEKTREVFAVLLRGVGRNALREVFH
ncbi:MAG: TetR family transcriptional regulator, partial [Eggerthellaceae bacterium]|nr:TetR family transcriptional regulator [Eggerthellaceae bacterium]